MNDAVLTIDGAFKRYGETQAVAGVDLTLTSGEILCLLGPSGSGKTSLLRLVAGLEHLDAGELRIGGETVDDARGAPRPPERRGLGMVFQDYALWPHLSVLDNVGLPLRERGRSDWRKAARVALEQVGLGTLERRHPYELSGGQQQRVALARAIAARPRLLLFDEPLSNLDAKLRDELREVIAHTVREAGIAALYITHDQSEAFFLADRLGVMRDGKLLQLDCPEAVYERPASPFVAHFTGAAGPFAVEPLENALSWAGIVAPCPSNAMLNGDGPAALYLRPQWLSPAEPGAGVVPGVVRVSGYAGDGWSALVDLPNGSIHLRLPQRVAAGERLHLRVDWDKALIYPRDHKR
ncbi:ABC transporter ATP-binding protein [Acidihalobacter prosperus]